MTNDQAPMTNSQPDRDSPALELLRLECALLKKQERLERERASHGRGWDWNLVIGIVQVGIGLALLYSFYFIRHH